jgi:hypothetical protein
LKQELTGIVGVASPSDVSPNTPKANEAEYPDMKSPADLLNCAQDANKVIKLMQVKLDGNDSTE